MRDVCPHTTVNLKRIIFGSLCVCVRVSSTIGRFHLCTHARQRKRFLIFCPDVPHYLWLIVRHALNEQEQEEEKASLSASSKSGLDLGTVFSFLPMWKLICAHVSWFQGISSFMSPNPFSRNASLLEMWAIIYWVAKNRFRARESVFKGVAEYFLQPTQRSRWKGHQLFIWLIQPAI